MTDIVERLRSEGSDALAKHYSLGMYQLCSDAADEIERLRAGGCARDQNTTQYCAELRAAVKAENEACAQIIFNALAYHAKAENLLASQVCSELMDAIRARMEPKP